MSRQVLEDEDGFDFDDLPVSDDAEPEEIKSGSRRWDKDDPRFFRKNGKRLSAESIKQIKLCDVIEDGFNSDAVVNQTFVVIPFKPGQDNAYYWERIRFKLPMPPSVNQWTRVFKGKAHASPAAKLYMKKSEQLLEFYRVRPVAEKLAITIKLYGLPPGSDIDGRVKQVFDCLHGTVIQNDYQFKDLRVIDMETPQEDGSYVEVAIKKILIDRRN